MIAVPVNVMFGLSSFRVSTWLLLLSDAFAYDNLHAIYSDHTIQSWKALRDQGVEKQDLDDSCVAIRLFLNPSNF